MKANPNDAVRDLMLRQLYGVHQKARGPIIGVHWYT